MGLATPEGSLPTTGQRGNDVGDIGTTGEQGILPVVEGALEEGNASGLVNGPGVASLRGVPRFEAANGEAEEEERPIAGDEDEPAAADGVEATMAATAPVCMGASRVISFCNCFNRFSMERRLCFSLFIMEERKAD
jgi:hypothetical protein